MFKQQEILEVIAKSKSEQWSYPKLFQALKNSGVESYEVDVASHQVTYYGHGQSMTEKIDLASPSYLPIASFFSFLGLQQAIRRNQAREIDYPQFLKSIATAGVMTYQVVMQERKIIYKGKNGERHIEQVPQA